MSKWHISSTISVSAIPWNAIGHISLCDFFESLLFQLTASREKYNWSCSYKLIGTNKYIVFQNDLPCVTIFLFLVENMLKIGDMKFLICGKMEHIFSSLRVIHCKKFDKTKFPGWQLWVIFCFKLMEERASWKKYDLSYSYTSIGNDKISSFKVISHVWQKVVFFLNILFSKMLKIGNTPWQILRRLPSKVLLKPNTSISFLLVCGGGEKLILLTGSISRECRRYILFQEKNKRALVFVPYFSPLYLTPISPTPSTKEKNRAGIKRNCSWH